MATFPCEYFTFTTKYPESGTRVQLGNSYMFTAPPSAPDQRIFTLTLAGMQYFTNPNGSINTSISTSRNMAVLEDFYNDHKLYLTFNFNHPVYGAIKCKFNRPLEVPKGMVGGNGVLETFDVELVEIP